MARAKKKKKPSASARPAASSRSANVGELAQALASEQPPLLVDVRTAFEYRGGHVPGSRNLPLNELAARMGELANDGEIWLICRTGARSSTAAATLHARGRSVVNVSGGTLAWSGAGRALDPPSSASQTLMWPLLASLTLGLAPFAPEPHVLGKLRWVIGGAVGMAPFDWLDLAMHGAPWIWFAGAALLFLRDKVRNTENK